MSRYITGFTDTLALEVDITFTDGGGNWNGFGSASSNSCTCTWTTAWGDYEYNDIPPQFPPIAPPVDDPPNYFRGVIVTLTATALGTTTSETFTVYDPSVLTGTVSISIPMREIAQIGVIPPFDNLGNPQQYRPWAAISNTYTHGTCSASITLFGVTKTSTASSTDDSRGADPNISLRSRVRIENGALGVGSQDVVASPAPYPATVDTATVSRGATTGGYTYAAEATATATQAYAEASVSGATSRPRISAEAVNVIAADRVIEFNGMVKKFNQTYPDPVEWRLWDTDPWRSASTGAITATVTQSSYRASAEVYDHAAVIGTTASDINIASGIISALKPMFKIPEVGGTIGNLMPARGPQWDPINLTKDDAITIDDGTTLTPSGDWSGAWTGHTGGSVAIVSGAVQVTGAAAKSVHRTFTGTGSWSGFSRLRLRLKCSAASHSITVRFGTGSWSVTTGAAATATNLYIDLGAEENGPSWVMANANVDGKRWYDRKWGSIFYIEDMGAGTYDIEEMELLTMPSGAGTSINIMPGGSLRMVSHTDEIQSMDITLGTPTSVTGTISEFVTKVNTLTDENSQRYSGMGWAATDLTPPGTIPSEPLALSYLTKSNHPSWMVGGYGLLWDSSGPTWTPTYSADGRGTYSPGDLPSQWLAYEIGWTWPGTELGGFLTDGILGCGMVVAGSFWGRVLEDTATQTAGDATAPAGLDPAASVTVTLLDTYGNTLATDTTDAQGFFSFPSAATFGIGRVAVSGRDGYIEGTTSNRTRAVLIRTEPPDGTLMAMEVSATGRVVRGYKDGSDGLLLEYWHRESDWERVTTSLTLTGGGALSFDRHGAEQRLWLDYEDSGGIKSRYTDDEGTTFSVATTITATGDYPALTHSPTSARHHFWIDGTAIKTLIQDSQGNTLTAAATVVASGVAASPIAATHDGETIILTYVNGSGQVISVISSNGGITFS